MASWRGVALLACAATAQGLTVKPAGWKDMMAEWMSDATVATMENLDGENSGDPASFGVFAAGEGFGFESGLIISSGSVLTAAKTSHDDPLSDDLGARGVAGDLAKLISKFSTASATNIYFEYVFASREMPEFGGSQLGTNDLYFIELNKKNISLLSDGTVANINNLVPAGTKLGRDKAKDHPDYIDNPLQKFIPYTGYTKVLKAVGTTVVGDNELSVCVSDEGDGLYDSAVFLKSKGLVVEGFTYTPDADKWGPCDCVKGVQSRTYTCRDESGIFGENRCSGKLGSNPLDVVTKSRATVFQNCTCKPGETSSPAVAESAPAEGVFKASPDKVHPLGGAVIMLEGKGFGKPGDPDPVVYIGPDQSGWPWKLYTHPQYARRISDTFIEIAAPITGWGQSGAMKMKIHVSVGGKQLESKLGVLTFTCECAEM